MKKVLIAGLLICALMTGCTTLGELSPKTKTGAGIGAVAGGILGAVVDSNKPWRGAIIGAAAGAAAGGWIGHTMDRDTGEPVLQADADIVEQAAKEAAIQNATVKYSRVTESGINEEIIAKPGDMSGSSRIVTIQYFRDAKLISTETRHVVI